MADADPSAVAPETQQTAPPTPEADGTTAAPQEGEQQPSGNAANSADAEKLKFAESYHRQRLGEIGNSVARVKPEIRQRLAANPTLIEEQEQELAYLRRAVSGGASVQQQAVTAKPEVDDAEVEAKAFLRAQGYTGKEEGYEGLLAYETERERRTQARIRREIEKAKPDTKALAENVRKEDRDAVWKEEFSEVVKSPEWNDAERGETFEGKFWRKVREIGKTRRWVPPSVLVAEIKAEMTPVQKPASKPRPQMGESPSGRAGAPAETDHFKSFDEAARAAGVDPSRF